MRSKYLISQHLAWHDNNVLPSYLLVVVSSIAADDTGPSVAFALLAGRRPLRTAGAHVTERGDAEWLQRSGGPRTVQHKAPLPRRGTDRGTPRQLLPVGEAV